MARVVGVIVAGIALVGAIVLIVVGGERWVDLLVVVGLLVSLAAASAAFTIHVDLPNAHAAAPSGAVLQSALRWRESRTLPLAKQARERGIEPIELKPGEDLETLVRRAVESGADGLAMAGGDGSQAIVAKVAAEVGLPYACVPAGTRNHFALDLGVDRDDVVGGLDAFVDGGERRVDLAEVNGRVFVNNVALGLYADAVQRSGYRDAKIRTLLDTMPDVVGPGGSDIDMRWRGPGGHEHHAGAVVMVSNNQYRLGHAVGSGTRPRIDDGLLGIIVVGAPSGRGENGSSPQRPMRQWSAPTFEIDADQPVPAGVDGEALVLDAPLLFTIRPGVLTVRVARKHPGASPSAIAPEGMWASIVELARIAFGHQPEPRKLNTRKATMNNKMEITEKERLSREDAAARLHALADELARHNDVEFDRGGMHFKVHVPDEVDFKLEIEFEDEEHEIEIELKW